MRIVAQDPSRARRLVALVMVMGLLLVPAGCGSLLLGAAGGAAAQSGGGGGDVVVIDPPTLRINSNLVRETGDTVTVNFTLTSAVSLTTVSLVAEFQIDGQADFQPATPADPGNPGTEDLAASPDGTALTFVWDSVTDLAGAAEDVIFRLTPLLGAAEGTADQEGPFNAGNEPPVATVAAINDDQSGNVVIEMNFSDTSADDVNVLIQFQTTNLAVDGTVNVTSQPQPATIIGTVTGLSSVKGDPVAQGVAPIVLVWDSAADLPSERVDAELQITATDTETGQTVVSTKFLVDNDTRAVVVPFRPFGDDAREIGLTFELQDPDLDPINVKLAFSTNGGLSFSPIGPDDVLATPPGETPLGLSTSAEGEFHHVIWPSQNVGAAFLGPGSHDVIFQLLAVDDKKGGVSGVVAETFPSFRVENGPLSEVNTQETARRPVSVAVGDVDNNGLDDVVALCDRALNVNPSLQIHLQSGDGELDAPLELTAQIVPVQVLTGDFNGDFRTDVVVIHNEFKGPGDQLLYYRQNDQGALSAPVGFGGTGGRVAAVVANLDGDANADLVVVNQLNLLNGQEPFYEVFTGSTGTAPPALAFTQDAFGVDRPLGLTVIDRAGGTNNAVVATVVDVAKSTSVFEILSINRGALVFEVEASGLSNAFVFSSNPARLDFNNDDFDDLAVAVAATAADPKEVALFLGRSDGTFRFDPVGVPNLPAGVELTAVSPVTGPFLPHSILVALDVDGNGSDDLAALSCLESKVVVFPHDADPSAPAFDAPVLFGSGLLAQAITAGDANGDRKDDVVSAATVGDALGVVAQVGQGTFASRQVSDAGAGPGAVASGDFNADGRADLVVLNSEDVLGRSVGMFFQNVAGILDEQLDLAAVIADQANNQGINSRDVAAGDLDGDGDDDLIVTLENGLVGVFLADQTATDGFALVTTSVVTADFFQVVVGDFDPIRSGLEIALVDGGGLAGRVSIAQITDVGGNPEIVETSSIAVVGTEVGLAVGDLFDAVGGPDADGIDDLLVTVANVQGVPLLPDAVGVFGFQNRPAPAGTPIFLSQGRLIDGTTLAATGATFIQVGDLDSQNGLDVALHTGGLDDGANSQLGLAFRQPDGSFAFSLTRDLGGFSFGEGMTVADVDGDGQVDLLVSNAEFDRLDLHLGPIINGPGALGEFAVIPSGRAPAGVLAGDFNHDGRPDVAAAAFAESQVSLVPGR